MFKRQSPSQEVSVLSAHFGDGFSSGILSGMNGGDTVKEHKYFCPMRPPTLGAVPKDGLLYVEAFKARKFVRCIGFPAWGYAVYSRPLTADEIADYELVPAPEGDA